MHYFSPVEKMPLLEVVVAPTTADEVTVTCVELGRRQGKTVIVVNDGPGFYTSRILVPYMNEVGHLLTDGVRIEDIDQAMTRWGFPVGPVTLADEVGIDVGAKIGVIMERGVRLADGARRGLRPAGGRRPQGAQERPRVLPVRGRGPTRGGPVGVRPARGHPGRRADAPSRSRSGCYLHVLNEAARCLEEGVLRSARDGDVGAVFGLGYPPFRGGPFTTIDRFGAADVVARLDDLAEATATVTPPPTCSAPPPRTASPSGADSYRQTPQ